MTLQKMTDVTKCGQVGHRLRDILSSLDGVVWWHCHQNAIDQNCDDNQKTEQRMDEHVYGHSPYRIERIQYPQGVGCAEPKNIFAFANYCKRLPKRRVRSVLRL